MGSQEVCNDTPKTLDVSLCSVEIGGEIYCRCLLDISVLAATWLIRRDSSKLTYRHFQWPLTRDQEKHSIYSWSLSVIVHKDNHQISSVLLSDLKWVRLCSARAFRTGFIWSRGNLVWRAFSCIDKLEIPVGTPGKWMYFKVYWAKQTISFDC